MALALFGLLYAACWVFAAGVANAYFGRKFRHDARSWAWTWACSGPIAALICLPSSDWLRHGWSLRDMSREGK
jgi:hypothetical protein